MLEPPDDDSAERAALYAKVHGTACGRCGIGTRHTPDTSLPGATVRPQTWALCDPCRADPNAGRQAVIRLLNLTGDDAPPRAEAVFSGHVLESGRRTNRLTGADFIWCLVETLGGVYDVVIDPELLPDVPRVGGVLQGSFWLSGRIAPA